jgi:hypothetical protein
MQVLDWRHRNCQTYGLAIVGTSTAGRMDRLYT